MGKRVFVQGEQRNLDGYEQLHKSGAFASGTEQCWCGEVASSQRWLRSVG